MTNAIAVQGLGKKYILRHRGEGRQYVALRDVLAQKIRGIFRRGPANSATREEFWALKSVNFEIKQGEAVGIIGRNGAGKSTLLKLLSRITKPTTGRIELNGRVASLLEVGTGFHPELTGRENVYLNGAIMGMSRLEIRRKFDEIVAFADVEKFLDTPVKHFSSGMYVRLAFAVAAHLDPEILIVDEVLAVGDLQFQKKCLTKMEDVTGKEGRTVLFVSHNMDLITKLCSRAILLQGGCVLKSGMVDEVSKLYLHQSNELSIAFEAKSDSRQLRYVAIDRDALPSGKLIVRIGFKYNVKVLDPVFGLIIRTEGGAPVTGSNSMYHPPASKPNRIREGEAVAVYDFLPFWSGRYLVSVWLNDGHGVVDYETNAITFEYVAPDTPLNAPSPQHIGPLHLRADWTIKA